MSLLGDEPLHIPARPVEVFDVSGAGDTVIAILAVFSAAGFDMESAARMANEATQFVVTPVYKSRLRRADKNRHLPHRT